MILKIFSPNNLMIKLAFLIQNKAKLCEKLIITLVLRKTPFFSKNCQKLPKFVIIISIPVFADGKPAGNFQSNDYRPEPTGGRADRIRGASENGSVKVPI
jgi:hypothetical protein